MANLKLRACGFSMDAKGDEVFVAGERRAFYEMVTGSIGRVVTDLFGNLPDEAQNGRNASEAARNDFTVKDDETVTKETSNGARGCCVGTIVGKTYWDSWKEIAAEIKQDNFLMSEGDSITFKLKNGQEVDAVITQITDEFVRFESRDCVGDAVNWNEEDDTTGGLANSNVIEYLNGEIFNLLPDDLQEVIAKAIRKFKDTDGDAVEFETKLFLPAASEVFCKDECYGDERLYEQLEYYKDRRNRMRGERKGEDTCAYWLASVRSGYSAGACAVSYYGRAGNCSASAALRVPLCFQISKS